MEHREPLFVGGNVSGDVFITSEAPRSPPSPLWRGFLSGGGLQGDEMTRNPEDSDLDREGAAQPLLSFPPPGEPHKRRAQLRAQRTKVLSGTSEYSPQRMCNPPLPPRLHLRKRLLSIKEAAEYLGRTVPALRELQWAGRLPYIQEGRRVMFDLLDLDTWIEAHKRRETHRLD